MIKSKEEIRIHISDEDTYHNLLEILYAEGYNWSNSEPTMHRHGITTVIINSKYNKPSEKGVLIYSTGSQSEDISYEHFIKTHGLSNIKELEEARRIIYDD